ncbi:MAG: phytanoyl-CoA dioxygenase family protein [Chlamydiia bacterium]|nr:phytanoyl-CoA dioxygenase family protein [Chlamydiia bacterium]
MEKFKLDVESQKNWNNNGYLHLKNVLSSTEIESMVGAVDQILKEYSGNKEKFENTETKPSFLGNHGAEFFNILQAIEHTEAFDVLLDHPKVFDKIVALVGPYLQVLGVDVFIRKPNQSLSDLCRFHTDGGPALQQFQPVEGMPILQLKVQFFLTDVPGENWGNFTLIPKSHKVPVNDYHPNCLIPSCNAYVEKGEMPPDAKQLIVEAGDVSIHPWSLWHAVAPNRSDCVRKSVSVRYGQFWCRPYFKELSSTVRSRVSPRQLRLLGDLGKDPQPNAFYTPQNQRELMGVC